MTMMALRKGAFYNLVFEFCEQTNKIFLVCTTILSTQCIYIKRVIQRKILTV